MAIKFLGIPTFKIHDYKEAKRYYVEFLGFKIDWEHWYAKGAPVYMQISRNGLVLHLSENLRFPAEIIAFVDTQGLKDFYQELKAKAFTYSLPEVAETNWQTLQLELEDPFGNLLRFNETILT